MTLKEIRAKVNSGNWYGKYERLTVVKRDGQIVVRRDIGSPRNSDLQCQILNGHVRRVLNAETTPNVYRGRKGIYSNWWVEAIIEDFNNEAE